MNEQQQYQLVTAAEEQRISRSMMAWINGWINNYTDLPETIPRVDFEQLPADRPGIALSVTQDTYIIKRFILGGHTAGYTFSVYYRIKPGTSNDARLKADEVLNAFGDWAVENYPDLGEGIRVTKLETTARAALLVPYENGDEDHQILMRMEYEVI